MTAEDVVAVATGIADDLLFPSAIDTDRAELVPQRNLDALADAGLYGLFGPTDLGGSAADLRTGAAVVEAIASGCLNTALVWLQHHGIVGTLLLSDLPVRDDLLADLVAGRRRSGIVFTGAMPGSPLRARRDGDGGWILDGRAPWVSGWGRVDTLLVSAGGPDDTVVTGIIEGVDRLAITAERHRLATLDASGTVELFFDDVPLPADRVTGVRSRSAGGSGTLALRLNGSLALGVVRRCGALIGPSPLDDELDAARTALDEADPDDLPIARAQAAALATKATASLLVHTGSRGIETDDHAQRLAREAMFLLVFATGPDIRAGLRGLGDRIRIADG